MGRREKSVLGADVPVPKMERHGQLEHDGLGEARNQVMEHVQFVADQKVRLGDHPEGSARHEPDGAEEERVKSQQVVMERARSFHPRINKQTLRSRCLRLALICRLR